ncbi:MAG: TIGR00159 family protein [Candidatus Eremiobacteraeota bacterium]|nr:TIGR00159 family protein [Candidatus Eremiobacteraeota bacterium]
MLSQVFAYVGPADVIDIIATSILIYYLILLIRGTRAVQILLGFFVLLGLLGLANVLHLFLLRTILQLIVVAVAVAIPIVFQPELRRVLEQIGRGGLFRMDAESPGTRHEDRAIAAMAHAAFLLSRSRLGGLIVIEQQSGLKEFCDTGTTLQAQLSAELLLAIFMPRSPLHDGAVIVRENLIEAAGCFLPLAELSLGKDRFGTRHRAALGISEQTDAVVIVVSEESGAITIARDGKLSRPVEEEARLAKMLLAVTRPPRNERRLPNDFVSHLRSRLSPPRSRQEPRADHPQELRT